MQRGSRMYIVWRWSFIFWGGGGGGVYEMLYMPTPTFPQAALGAVLQYSVTGSSYVQLGVYDGDAGSHERGTQIDLDSAQGVAIAVEVGTEAGSWLRVHGYGG